MERATLDTAALDTAALSTAALDTAALGRAPVLPDGSPTGAPSPYACSGCHGVLDTVPDPRVLRLRCRTGQAWSADPSA